MIVAGLVRALLWLADHDPVPNRLVGVANRAMVYFIRLYRLVGSGRSGRTCLFSRSCSARSLDAFLYLGWREGLAETARQLRRCGGEFTIITSVRGEVMMIASDGMRFTAEDLSAAIIGDQAVRGLAHKVG